MADFPPWINDADITAKGTGPRQQNSTEPAIDDLYKSPTVVFNGVPVVLYNNPTANGGDGNIHITVAMSVPDTNHVPIVFPLGSSRVIPSGQSGVVPLPITNAPTVT